MQIDQSSLQRGTMENIASKAAARSRAAFGASVGTLIEYYDYYLYGLAAATVFPKVFFPSDSVTVAQLSSFASFAIGFLLRPIGVTAAKVRAAGGDLASCDAARSE